MLKRPLLVAILGMILGVQFGGTAHAATAYTRFTMQPQAVQVGVPVVFTDTTVNKTGLPFQHDWIIYGPGGFYVRIAAGDPHCLNSDCSKVQLVPMQAGRYNVTESVTNSAVDAVGQTTHFLAVYDADHPLLFRLTGPTTIELPAVIEILSPSSSIAITSCNAPELTVSYWSYCDPYLMDRPALNSEGLYRHRYKFAVGPTGTVEMAFTANARRGLTGASDQEFTFSVTKSNKQFVDADSCYKGNGTYSFTYYNTTSSKVIAKLQVRRDKRWVTQKSKQSMFTPDAEPVEIGFFEDPSPGRSPWFHRYLYARFGPPSMLGSKRRIIYEIKHGNRLLKRSQVSKKPCNKQRAF